MCALCYNFVQSLAFKTSFGLKIFKQIRHTYKNVLIVDEMTSWLLFGRVHERTALYTFLLHRPGVAKRYTRLKLFCFFVRHQASGKIAGNYFFIKLCTDDHQLI